MIGSLLFIFWRLVEITFLIPIIGMLVSVDNHWGLLSNRGRTNSRVGVFCQWLPH